MNLTKKNVEYLTYTASTNQELDLPTEGIITRIDLDVSTTPSAQMDNACSTQAIWRIVNTLKIQGGKGRRYFDMSGAADAGMGILLHYINLVDYPNTTWRTLCPASAVAMEFGLRLHFGSKPRDEYGRDNPFDLTAGIPAGDEPSLKLIWGCPANTVIDTTTTVGTTYMYATIHYVLGASTANLMIPISSTEGYVPGATKADLSGEVNIPTGSFLRRVAVMCQDHQDYSAAGPLLMTDQVTELGIRLAKDNRRLIEVRAKTNELAQPVYDGFQVADTPNTLYAYTVGGLYLLDLRAHGDPNYGMDLRGLQTGAVKLATTIGAYTSGDVEYCWFDQVQPYRK